MKKVRIKSAVPIYLAAAVWLLIGLISPGKLLNLVSLLQTVICSAAVYAIASKVFPGKVVEVREQVDTGDAELNRQIEESRSQLEKLRLYNEQLPDPVISERLDRMVQAGETILSVLEENPSRAMEIRRFMSYFLPTAEKLMSSYVSFAKSPVKGDNVSAAMKSVEESLSMVADAFEKQCDSLYRNESFNIEAEVTVLETLLKGDGLVGDMSLNRMNDAEKSGTKLTL